MSLARWQRTIVDDAGNIQNGASIEVRREGAGAPLATIYSDREGTTLLGNPFTAGSDGLAAFHVIGDVYRITATKGAFSVTWRYVGVGTAAEFDAESVVALVQQVDAGYALAFEAETAAPPSAGSIRFDNADLSLATHAYVDLDNLAGSSIEDRLLDLYSSLRSVKDGIILTDPASDQQASFRVTGAAVDGSPATYIILSLSDHDGATSFTDGERINLQRERAGADGSVSGPGSATDGNLPSFNGASGAVLQDSGVPAARVAVGPSGGVIIDQLVIFSNTDGNAVQGATDGASPETPITMASILDASAIAAATESAQGVAEMATDAEIRSAATGAKAIMAEDLETAAAAVAVSSSSNATAVNWDSGVNFTLTTSENTAISNPSNGQPGTWRTILIQGNDGTSRTITFGNQFLGELPTITDCTSSKWYILMIYCVSTSHFVVSSKRAKG